MSRSGIQIALLIGALLTGVLLGRLLDLPTSSPPTNQRTGASVADRGNTKAVARTDARSDATESVAAQTNQAQRTADASSGSRRRALDEILAEDDPRARLRDLQAFINALRPNSYGDAFKRIRQITNANERELASRLLLTQWALDDPDGALQFAAGNRGFEYVAEDVFQQLAAADFNAAVTRAQSIPGNDLRYRALRGVLTFKAESDPRGALELANSIEQFRGNEPLANVVYRNWAATDPQTAAAEAAAASGSDQGWRSPINAVVQTWADQDPAAAAKWALSLSDAPSQGRSLAQVMREWTQQDAQGAANWIHSLESGASRDAAVAGLGQALAATDPQTAINWIGTINDEGTRMRTLQRVSGIVTWSDPQNGPAMLQAAGLPPDQIRGGGRRGRGAGQDR